MNIYCAKAPGSTRTCDRSTQSLLVSEQASRQGGSDKMLSFSHQIGSVLAVLGVPDRKFRLDGRMEAQLFETVEHHTQGALF